MERPDDLLTRDDRDLLEDCEVHIYKASGPGGQHRNKVSSAVRLHHRPTGITATANDSRSQQDNRRLALRRLKMNLALRLRRSIVPDATPSALLRECLHTPKKKTGPDAPLVLQIGRKDDRFWAVAAELLDRLEACEGRIGDVGAQLGTSTGQVTSVLKSDRHLLAAAQEIRKRFGHRPIH